MPYIIGTAGHIDHGKTSLIKALTVDSICQFLNLKREETRTWLERTEGLRSFDSEREQVYLTEEKWNGFRERLRSTLAAFHQSHPLVPGMDLEEVRARLAASVSVRLFRNLTDLLASEGACVRDGNHVRLPDHRVELGAQEKSLSGEITAALAKTPLAPPYLKEIEKALGVERPRLNEVIRVMERQGEIWYRAEWPCAWAEAGWRGRARGARCGDQRRGGFRIVSRACCVRAAK